MRAGAILATLAGLAWCAPRGASAGTVPTGFTDLSIIPSLDAPVGLTFLPDGRLLVIEQKTANVRLVILSSVTPPPTILTVPEVENSGGEQGLLGIAVDPGWPSRPYLYLHYDHQGDFHIHVARFTVTGDLDFTGNGMLAIDTGSRYDILTDVPDGASNHNGGTLRFGPDGMLYASFGEDAVRCAAQDTVSLRGVILRLDITGLPAGPGGPPAKDAIAAPGNPFLTHPNENAHLVWALGLRNPFRFHIDMPTGDVFIADVGEETWEEIDRAPVGGLNFGWPHREGPVAFNQSCPDNNTVFVDPIYAFNRAGTSAAIISAGRYRRPASGIDRFPASYDGDYFFIDYYLGFLRRLTGSGNAWSIAASVPGQPSATNWGTGFEYVSDWALGPSGALFYVRQFDASFQPGTGEVRRISYASGAAPNIGSVTATPEASGHFAVIRWLTDIPSSSRVDFGIDPATLDRSVTDASDVLQHVVLLSGLEPLTSYYLRVTSDAPAGGATTAPDPPSPPLSFTTPAPPLQLLAPFPSPAVGAVTLPYDLAADAVVTMRLYDSRGRWVRTLVGASPRSRGNRAETWDGRDDKGHDAPAGVYIVRLEVGGQHLERRFPLIR